ncbi:MAG: class I SAM-dependent methyltransferase [Actinomycetota bacterium]|nr:class I SAM-dependent methyltransferase [Actinomycetota bacterium]
MTAIPQQLFSSAVTQYARYRTGYPLHEVAALADLLGLDHTQTVIDVGCGTGQLALPLSQHAGSVIAVDPVPAMLTLGRHTAQATNTSNITWLLGDASNLETLVAPGAHAATFAASFHWTDRPEVVRALDRLLEPEGSIVIINDDLSDVEDPDWVRAITDLRRSYLGDRHTELTDPHRNTPDSHRTVLSNSTFSNIQSVSWQWNRELTADEAVGLQFTYSFSTPALFGDQAAAFARDARAAVLAMYPAGRVTEPFRMEVLIASRPDQ